MRNKRTKRSKQMYNPLGYFECHKLRELTFTKGVLLKKEGFTLETLIVPRCVSLEDTKFVITVSDYFDKKLVVLEYPLSILVYLHNTKIEANEYVVQFDKLVAFPKLTHRSIHIQINSEHECRVILNYSVFPDEDILLFEDYVSETILSNKLYKFSKTTSNGFVVESKEYIHTIDFSFPRYNDLGLFSSTCLSWSSEHRKSIRDVFSFLLPEEIIKHIESYVENTQFSVFSFSKSMNFSFEPLFGMTPKSIFDIECTLHTKRIQKLGVKNG